MPCSMGLIRLKKKYNFIVQFIDDSAEKWNSIDIVMCCCMVLWCSSSFIELNAFTLWSLWHFLIKIDNTFRHLWRLILFLRINSIAFERTCHNITENDITGTYLVWIKLKTTTNFRFTCFWEIGCIWTWNTLDSIWLKRTTANWKESKEIRESKKILGSKKNSE